MATKAGSAGISTTGWVAAGAIAVAVFAAGLYFAGVFTPQPDAPVDAGDANATETASPPVQPEPETDAENAVATTESQDTAVVTDATPDTESEPQAGDTQDAIALVAPAFDVVRVDPDGTTVIAGTGPAGSLVTIFMDGNEHDAIAVDSQGKFVSLLFIEPSDVARLLTLEAQSGEHRVESEDQIILAPNPSTKEKPVVVAEADTKPKTTPEVTSEPVAGSQPVAEPAPVAQAAPDAEPSTTADDAPVTETASTADNAPVAEPSTTADNAPETDSGPTAEPAPVAQPEEPATPAPVTVLRADAEGVELLQPSTDADPDDNIKLVLDTIGYSDAGDVLLSGRAAANSVIRVYLDNKVIVDFDATADGRWRGKMERIVPGLYTLRLDAVDADGKVTSRLETPFVRENPEDLKPLKDTAAAQTSDASDTTPAKPTPPIRVVTVQTGDTLWAISRERYGDGVLYVKVFEANRQHIRDPDLIYPGQVFAIPDE